jgi:hypothetical protein
MLALSLSKDEGFWLLCAGRTDERWLVAEVFLARGFVLEGPKGEKIEIGSDRETHDDEVEIASEVWVSDGHRHIVGRARVVFNAPQSVIILRDELYEERKRKEARVA